MTMIHPYDGEIDRAYVQQFAREIKSVLKQIQKKFTDSTIPLEDRWEMYKAVQSYLKTDSSYMSFDTLDNITEVSWYDDFYLERYAVQQLDVDFVQKCVSKFKLDVPQIESLKEEILVYASKGYGAFQNDW